MHKLVCFLRANCDSLYLIIGNAVSRILIIISTFIMIQLLGDYLYSKYAVLYSGVLALQVFATFGLNAIATKKVATGEIAFLVFKRVVFITSIITIILFILLYLVLSLDLIESINFFNEVDLIILGFCTYSLVIYSCVVSILYGKLEKVKVATLNIFNSILILLFLSAASFYKNLSALLLCFGIANMFSLFLAIFFLSKDIFVKKNDKQKYKVRDYISNGFPVFLSALLVSPVLSVVYILMNKGGFGRDIAVFSVALQWYSVILFIPGVLANLLLAKFSMSSNLLNFNQYVRQISINFIISVSVSFFVCLILFFALPLYGENYFNHSMVFVLFVLTAVVNSLNTVTGQILLSIGKQWYGFFFNIIWAVVLLALVSVFINLDYGLEGIACSFLIAYVFHAIYQNIYVINYFKGLKNE